MAKNDDKDDLIFPTRTGNAIGASRENRLIFNAQGAHGIVKRVRENPDGSITRLDTRAGNPRFITEPAPTNENEEPACPLSDVGFVNSYYNINGVYPITENLTWRLYTLYGSSGAVRTAKHAPNSVTKKETLARRGSTQFSGMMRRVVQVSNGTNQPTHPFQCGWENTDGLFIGLTNDESKVTRYVIRINSSGIWRIPIEFCKELLTTWKVDEQQTIAEKTEEEAHKRISPYWTYTKFTESRATKIGDAPPCFAEAFAPFYSWCGWAFNYDGTKATVVCVGFSNETDTWLSTRLYDITISSENGVPSSASTALSGESVFINPYNDGNPEASGTARLQVASTLPGYLDTFVFHDAIHYPVSAPDQDAPVFSYYESSGRKIIVRYKYVSGVNGVRTTSFQTPVTSYLTPVGTFQSTSAISGSPITYPIDPGPPEPSVPLFIEGLYSRTTTGDYGKTDTGFYSYHIAEPTETLSANISDVSLEPSGYCVDQDAADKLSGRLLCPRLYWCVKADASSTYAPNGWMYVYPLLDVTIGYKGQTEYIYQVQSGYTSSSRNVHVLLLHGYDRESYAVTSFSQNSTGLKTESRNTSGPLSNFTQRQTMSPEVAFFGAYCNDAYTPFTPVGQLIKFGEGVTDTSVGGWEFQPPIIGKIAGCPTTTTFAAPTAYVQPTSSTEYKTMVVVGEEVVELQNSGSEAFAIYYGGDLFMFRACSSAFNRARSIYSTDVNGELSSRNLGGVKPSSSITTFIGVF